MRAWKKLVAMLVFGLVGFCSIPVRGDFVVNVTIVDPTNSFTAYHSAITSHAIASGNLWGSHFFGTTNVELEVLFDDNFPRATGASITSSFVANRNGFNIYEQGLAAEIRTGTDPNGAGAFPRLRFGL